MPPLLIYVAGPYSADTGRQRAFNVCRALEAGLAILEKGHWPFIPHLTHFFDKWHCWEGFEPAIEAETYMQWDFVILRRCDGLLYLSPSPGADRELELARQIGVPFWTSIEDVPHGG